MTYLSKIIVLAELYTTFPPSQITHILLQESPWLSPNMPFPQSLDLVQNPHPYLVWPSTCTASYTGILPEPTLPATTHKVFSLVSPQTFPIHIPALTCQITATAITLVLSGLPYLFWNLSLGFCLDPTNLAPKSQAVYITIQPFCPASSTPKLQAWTSRYILYIIPAPSVHLTSFHPSHSQILICISGIKLN